MTDTTIRDAFWTNGFAVLPHAAPAAVVDAFRTVADDNLANPTHLQSANGEPSVGIYVYHTDKRIPALLQDMGIADQVASVLGTTQARLFYDQFLDKCGGEAGTVWHQDHTYWPIKGALCCTTWLALDDVTQDTGALRYCRRSHAEGTMWRPTSRLTGDDYWADTNLPPIPDIDADGWPDGIASVPIPAGDMLIHHSRTLHGSHPHIGISSGRRRAYIARWLGDDVLFDPRPRVMDFPFDPGLVAGAPMDSPYFPQLASV